MWPTYFSRYARQEITHYLHATPFFCSSTKHDRVPFVDPVNSANFFSVPWEKDPMTFAEIYPSLNNSCGNGVCKITVDENVLFWAFRYALGRQTYVVDDVSKEIVNQWNNLSQTFQRLTHKEILQAIENDSVGMIMDKESWQKVLDLEITTDETSEEGNDIQDFNIELDDDGQITLSLE